MSGLPKLIESNIAEHIYFIRGEKAILDVDLAILYGIETRVLKQSVRRNLNRFPDDFMFQLSEDEINQVVSHFVIPSKSYFGGAKPFAFTEQGVAMLSGILNSDRAIAVNIAIMRTFIQMRKLIASYKDIEKKINELENKYDKNFSIVFEALKQLIRQESEPRKRIGFKTSRDE